MITLSDLLASTGAQIFGAVRAEAWPDFCHDSRLAEPGQLFVALRTPTGDGHDHIADAVARGCTGVICQHAAAAHPPVTTLLAPDTGDALRAWASHILRQRQPLVIAITGSSGKTTAKELLADLLERAYPDQVFRSRESYNDRLGAPLALGRLRAQHRFAVLELGTDSHGEIAALAALVQPAIAGITTINDAHIGALGSLAAIAAEKLSLLRALPADGVAVINLSDPAQAAVVAQLGCRVLTHRGEEEAWETALVGAHQRAAIATAAAIARHLGVPETAIRAGVAAFRPLPGRLRPLPGLYGFTLLDDTYSANPAATRAALRALAAFPGPRLAILGEHSGLGLSAEPLLAALGADAAAHVDHLIAVGSQAQIIARATATPTGLSSAQVHLVDTPAAAAEVAAGLMAGAQTHPGVALLKGSREARLERAAAALLAEPAAASQVLVRQSPAWHHLRLRNTLRPTWVEIDTLALAGNLDAARALLQPGVRLIAVLKADAYGHGAPVVARIAVQHGAACLAVACLPEAQALRRAGVAAPILILGYTPPWQARAALELDVQLTLYDPDVAQAVDQAAAALGRRASVHVKVDTGMGRLGLLPHETAGFLAHLRSLSHLDVAGLFTHMANADAPGDAHTEVQLRRFAAVLAEISAQGLRPPLVHAANTATLLTRPDAQFDAVRVGIGLYGLAPAPALPLPPGFAPVLAWKTTIAQVKTLPPGAPVGYGLTYTTAGEQRVAVIPVGYADGFRRSPHNWGEVLVRGQRAALVGRVSMDQAAIDVTHIAGVRGGDEVVLIGRQGDAAITADQVAARLGTISYEVISGILARVPRLAE